jgi:hypothetical protein
LGYLFDGLSKGLVFSDRVFTIQLKGLTDNKKVKGSERDAE